MLFIIVIAQNYSQPREKTQTLCEENILLLSSYSISKDKLENGKNGEKKKKKKTLMQKMG